MTGTVTPMEHKAWFQPFWAACDELQQRLGCPPKSGLELEISPQQEVTASAYWDDDTGVYRIILSEGLLQWTSLSAQRFSASVFPLETEQDQNDGLRTYLTQSWLLAILSHELTHVGAGHIDYLSGRSGSALKIYDELSVRRLGVGRDKVPLRFFEYEADFGAGLWLADFAQKPPTPISRWVVGEPQQNLIVALVGFGLFSFRLEAQVRQTGRSSQNYPAPLLRFGIVTSSIMDAWQAATPDSSFAETIMQPVLEMFWSVKDQFPEVGFVQSFADPSWMNKLQEQVEELASETSQYGDFIKPYRLSSFTD